MSECAYPNCDKCDFDYCIKDGVISPNLPPKRKDRTEYHKKYYKEHKTQKQAYYVSKKQYLSKVQVTSLIKRLKKEIGNVNSKIILEEIDKLEVHYIGSNDKICHLD